MPKVSVIVPVYNTSGYLCRCLNSILNQTLADIEIICVNDGSTDSCCAILQDYAQKDARIVIINQDNKGLSASRNTGVVASKGDYIAFIDSDDFVHERFLEVLYSAMIKTNADVAGCDFVKVSNDKLMQMQNVNEQVYENPLSVLLHRKNFIYYNVWNKLYKADIVKNVQFVEGIYFEDWIYNLFVFAQISSFVWVDEKLYSYNVANNSIMRSKFTDKKLEDYISGIEIVADFYNKYYPQYWNDVKNNGVSRIVKTLMNFTIRSKNKALMKTAGQGLSKLYNLGFIGYKGLSFVNKLKLFKFLHFGE